MNPGWTYVPHTGGSLFDVRLLHGWFPIAISVITALLVLAAVIRRSKRWGVIWLPIGALAGAIAAVTVFGVLDARGLEPGSAPAAFWTWIVVAVGLLVAAIVGVRTARWWQNGVTAVAVLLSVFCLALSLNQWSGYYPTFTRAWAGISDEPLPRETTLDRLNTFRNSTSAAKEGRIVAIDVPHGRSGFRARTEYVYLPPAWFTGAQPPRLPAVMMIGGVINTPEDWVRSGDALQTVDAYARDHRGVAPILVLPDPSGNLTTDTECVDGPRGNVDTHLVDEVRPYVVQRFGASPAARNWAVVGWSMGGTCAIDLVARHPDDFATFVDISGDIGPNTGDKQTTIKTLFGNDEEAWNRFDPTTVMLRHGPYRDVAGWFVSEGRRGRDGTLHSPQITAATKLAQVARLEGITTTERYEAGTHTWSFGAQAWGQVIAWLHERIDDP
ncbi:alpha/beta hydrolase, partial [Williamsia deligens]